MASKSEVRAAWLAELLSTAPADRARAEAGARRLYSAAGFAQPRHFLWYESPFAASWAIALLIAPYYAIWRERLSPASLSSNEKQQLDRTRASLGERLGSADWNAVRATVGAPRGMHMQFPPNPARMFHSALLEARYATVDDIGALFTTYGDDDALARAETHFWGSNKGALLSALHAPTTSALIGHAFVSEYSFSSMADDELRVADRDPPPVMHAAWEVSRSAGLWWPFENAAVLSERPTEVHVNALSLLHRGDGPAAVYPDGSRVFAWNGKAVPERWIMQPETVPARELKGFDASFRKYVESRVGKPASAAKKRPKAGSILEAVLPTDPAARLEQLRAHAGGRLPLFDRYQAGEHQPVWRELMALGARVREDPNAADALAVAYETMRRVQANVRTLVERLRAIGYEFTGNGATAQRVRARPHVPPKDGVRKALARFEKEAGTLPLSLRAFYEVVGEVNLIGHHPALAPRGGAVAPDPLVVYGVDEGLAEFDDEEGDAPSSITIAPDDLHKANTSGGAPYEVAIPDLRADGELLNERHRLFFVDYLRLCFEFGGFPGYEGMAEVPREIGMLREGMEGL